MSGELREKITYPFLILKEALKSFLKNNNLDTSAALAYYGFFALIPLLLLTVYLLGNYIMSSSAAFRVVEKLTSQMFPEFSKVIIRELYALSRHKAIWGTVTIITLFWSIMPLTSAFRNSFNRIFRVECTMPFFKATVRDALAVIVILVLFIFLVLSEISYAAIIGQFLQEMPFFFKVSNFTASLLITIIFISLFYLAFSPVKLRLGYILTGAIVTAVLWSVMRPVFSLFIKFNPNYGFAFGSLKAIFILVVWVYFVLAVMLLAAEIMSAMKRRDALLLKGLFLNASLSEKSHKMIINKFAKDYNSGDIVFNEGCIGDEMFHIFSGSVAISRHGQIVKILNEGEYFGEMSMLINEPRTANASAVEDNTKLIVITKNNFETILREEPGIVLSFLKEMALRLKTASEHM